MDRKIIAERIFTAADLGSFAAFSGDINPMHIDEVAARRTIFGAPVVHGMYLLCWALESLFKNHIRTSTALTKLTASFNRGVLVGKAVQTAVVKEGDEFTLEIRHEGATMSLIQGRLGPAVAYLESLPPPQPMECRANDYTSASQAHGALPLSYRAATADRLFPSLSAALPPFQMAALLATTRLVGMESPGLNSLYSAMEITFDTAASGRPEMYFCVDNADPRFGLLSLNVRGPGFHGKLRAFLRPGPCLQASVSELAGLVEEGEFAGQQALVIGGSRGLGEIAAKLLAVGGADVTITHHRGKEDAESVATEINAAGGRCQVAFFDSNHPTPIATPAPPTHLYYFATPHITSDRSVPFSVERFTEYCRCYVTAFVQTLLQFAQGAPTIKVLYPSTVFLNEPPQMSEYCAAKVAGEEVCRHLAGRFPNWRIYAPRLPRMHTDQNNGLLRLTKTYKPEEIILPYLRALHQDRPDN